MLVLYETAMGYCLFKVTDAAKLESADLWKEFESPERASKLYVGFNNRRPLLTCVCV
jgi:nucleolar protein 58